MGHHAHSLTLVRRGQSHVHTWVGECSCGWSSIPGRRASVERFYRVHVDQLTHLHTAAPRATTPVDQLPELLRV